MRSRKGNARGIARVSTERVLKDSQGKGYVTYFMALFGPFDHRSASEIHLLPKIDG